MHCPKCDKKAKCLDSRPRKNGETYRRYDCACGNRFSTTEWFDTNIVRGDQNMIHMDRYKFVRQLSYREFDILKAVIKTFELQEEEAK